MSIIWRLLAVLITLIAGWLFWGGLHAVNIVVSRGSSVSDALLQPPTSLVRLVATSVMLIGGLLLIFRRSVGKWILLVGILLFTLLAGLMAASGADPVLWIDEAITTGILWLLFAGLVVTKRS